MSCPWDRVAFRISVFDVDEFELTMIRHGWDLDDVEDDVQPRMRLTWFVPVDDAATLPAEPDLVEYATQPAAPAPAYDPVRDPVDLFWKGVIAYEVWDHMNGSD